MKTIPQNLRSCSAIAAALLTFTSLAQAEVQDKITKSFMVPLGGQLTVTVDRGDLQIDTAEAGAVEIEVVRKAGGSDTKAAQTLKEHIVTIGQTNNTVTVHAEFPGQKQSNWSWLGGSPKLNVHYHITVPRQFNVDLKTAGGDIAITELTGKAEAATSGGDLKFTKLSGPLTARTSGGDITLATVKGAVELATSGGDLHLTDLEGDVSARTSGGEIHIENITGKIEVKTSGGDIEVTGIKGQIEAATSGGDISAKFVEQPTGDSSFKTSGGDVTIQLGAKVAVDLDASTSGDSVQSDFPVVSASEGKPRKNRLTGKINGGGPSLVAKTSGGEVRIEKR